MAGMARMNIGMQIGKKDMEAETPISLLKEAEMPISLLKEAETPTMDDGDYIGRGNNTTTPSSIATGAKRKMLHGSMLITARITLPVPQVVKACHPMSTSM